MLEWVDSKIIIIVGLYCPTVAQRPPYPSSNVFGHAMHGQQNR